MGHTITSVALGLAGVATARADYARVAPVEQCLMADRSAEIELARSAAPDSVSRDAEVLVLMSCGYETVAKGGNGFVCFVERSWSDGSDDPEFWNPKGRAPLCVNAPAVRSYPPVMRKRTDLALVDPVRARGRPAHRGAGRRRRDRRSGSSPAASRSGTLRPAARRAHRDGLPPTRRTNRVVGSTNATLIARLVVMGERCMVRHA